MQTSVVPTNRDEFEARKRCDATKHNRASTLIARRDSCASTDSALVRKEEDERGLDSNQMTRI